MSRSDGSNHGARRRTVLKLLSAATGAAALPATSLGQTGDGESSLVQREFSLVQRQFSLVQGDRCVPVTPLAGDQPVEEFYDWNEGETDYSSAGTTDLQRDDTSILFLYDGPNGTSLVLVHGHYDSSESGGGSVSMTFTGLPEGGEWVVEDDLYDGDQNYDNWNHDGTRSDIDWTYRFSRTDGGAFLGMDGDVELRIEPAFNDASEFGDEYYPSELADWQVLSGDAENPDRASLAMDQPVVIRSGGCDTATDLDDGGSIEDEETDGDGSGGTEAESGGEETEQDGTETQRTKEEDETDGEDEDRRRTKHERKREKHRKKREKHRQKHEKKQQKHREKHRKQLQKHQKRQRKHEKEEEEEEEEEEEREERRERKHRRKREKHRKRERKHEREDADDSRRGPDGLGDDVTSLLDGMTGRGRDD